MFCYLLNCLVQDWNAQVRANTLVSPLDGDSISLADALRFTLTFARRYRSKPGSPKVSPTLGNVITLARQAFMSLITKLADEFICKYVLHDEDSKATAPPSLNNRDVSPQKRPYAMVSHEAKWKTLALARKVPNVTAGTIASLSSSNELGCSDSATKLWMRKEQFMYLKQCWLSLSSGAHRTTHTSFSPHPTRAGPFSTGPRAWARWQASRQAGRLLACPTACCQPACHLACLPAWLLF